MIKIMIGLFASYLDGLEPSKIPPCAGALAVLTAVAMLTAMPLLTVIVVVLAAILKEFRLAAATKRNEVSELSQRWCAEEEKTNSKKSPAYIYEATTACHATVSRMSTACSFLESALNECEVQNFIPRCFAPQKCSTRFLPTDLSCSHLQAHAGRMHSCPTQEDLQLHRR